MYVFIIYSHTDSWCRYREEKNYSEGHDKNERKGAETQDNLLTQISLKMNSNSVLSNRKDEKWLLMISRSTAHHYAAHLISYSPQDSPESNSHTPSSYFTHKIHHSPLKNKHFRWTTSPDFFCSSHCIWTIRSRCCLPGRAWSWCSSWFRCTSLGTSSRLMGWGKTPHIHNPPHKCNVPRRAWETPLTPMLHIKGHLALKRVPLEMLQEFRSDLSCFQPPVDIVGDAQVLKSSTKIKAIAWAYSLSCQVLSR